MEREPFSALLVPYPPVIVCDEGPNIWVGIEEESHRPVEIIVLIQAIGHQYKAHVQSPVTAALVRPEDKLTHNKNIVK